MSAAAVNAPNLKTYEIIKPIISDIHKLLHLPVPLLALPEIAF